MQNNNPGFQYVNSFTEANIAEWVAYQAAAQPPFNTIVGAGQYPQALGFANWLIAQPWQTQVIFRDRKRLFDLGYQHADNGIHLRMTPDFWFSQVGRHYVDKGGKWLMMPDNEGFSPAYGTWMGSLKPNAPGAMKIAHDNGVRLAVGAFFTHNPPKGFDKLDPKDFSLWATLIPMFEALVEYPEHVFAPHIYWSRPPKSVENLDGFTHTAELIAYMAKLLTVELSVFTVCITEYGRAHNPDGKALDARRGWVSDGIGPKVYADEFMQLKREKSDPHGWHVNGYCKGFWPDDNNNQYGVPQAFDQQIIDNHLEQTQSIDLPKSEPPIVIPPYPPLAKHTDPRWVGGMAAAILLDGSIGKETKVRPFPTTAGNNPLALVKGAGNLVSVIKDIPGAPPKWWQIKGVHLGREYIGWIHSDYISFTPLKGDTPDQPCPTQVYLTASDLEELKELLKLSRKIDDMQNQYLQAKQGLYDRADSFINQLTERNKVL